MEDEMPPYILEKSTVNGFEFYKYLHIRGGAGNENFHKGKRLGGLYTFLVYYATPDEMKGCDYCEKLWCEDKKIPFGIGKTINAAYKDYLKTKNQQP